MTLNPDRTFLLIFKKRLLPALSWFKIIFNHALTEIVPATKFKKSCLS